MDTIGKGAGTGISKAYELLYPYALSLFIGIIELIAQNGSNVDFIDNIYHAFLACMFRIEYTRFC